MSMTIHEAAGATGWSPRMLRYVEQLGLVEPPRSAAGYRLYASGDLERLRTLRELLERHDLELGEVGFALRLRHEPQLAAALDTWLDAQPRQTQPRPTEPRQTEPRQTEPFAGAAAPDPGDVADGDWLAYEQAKHQQLLQR